MTGDEVSLETIGDHSDWGRMKDEWDALVRAQPRPCPFLLHGWATAWWETYGERGRLAVTVARRSGRLVAALPLFLETRGPVRVARFVGGVNTEVADLLVAPDEPLETAHRVLATASAGDHDVFDVFGLAADSHLVRAAGPRMKLLHRAENPVCDLSPGWEAVYETRMSPQQRRLHRRRRRQLAKLGDVEVSTARSLDALEPALEESFDLNTKRWEGLPDRSGFSTSEGRRFHRAAIRALEPTGVPRIVSLRIDGRAIAFYYFLLIDGWMYTTRLAYDPEFSKFSPGIITLLDALETACADGARHVDFLGGTERYKLDLADGVRPLHEGLCFARRLGRGWETARRLDVSLRRRLKASPTARSIYFQRLAPLRRARAKRHAE